MKTCLTILMTFCLAVGLNAEAGQPTAKTEVPPQPVQSLTLTVVKSGTPSQVQGHGIAYSGVVPQLIKTKQPLQLINPAAPAQYWQSNGNADRDIITGKFTGFKLLTFNF
jgi:hypothetical protein